MSDEMKSVVALGIGYSRVRVMCNKKLDNIEVAIPCSPLHGSCDQITSKSVHLGTLLQEVPTGRDLRIDCSPMQRRYVLFVPVGSCGPTRFNQVPYERNISSLSGNEYI